MLTVQARPITTVEASNKSLFQTFTMIENTMVNTILAGLVFYNDPDFTNIVMKVYSNLDGAPDQLIMTSNNQFISHEIYPEGYLGASKVIGFDFDPHPFQISQPYHAVINITGYTYSDNKHIAWRHSWPDPVYQRNLVQSTKRLLNYPRHIVVLGSEIK